MRMMLWWILAAVGVAVMVWAHRSNPPVDESLPFSSGRIYVLKPGVLETDAKGEPLPVRVISARMAQLPLTNIAAQISSGMKASNAKAADQLAFQLSEKLWEFSFDEAGVDEKALAWGRLPQPGKSEVIAGSQAKHRDQIEIAGQTLAVVGGLRRDSVFVSRSYLLPSSESSDRLFGTTHVGVRPVVFVPLTKEQLADEALRKALDARVPADQYNELVTSLRMERNPYYGYLFGQVFLCLGGSGGLIGIYRALASRVRWRILAEPLGEITRYRRLMWGVHLAYFGTYFLFALGAYELSDVQNTFLAVVHSVIAGGEGPLGVAGKAYLTRSIPVAALVTFAVNFFIGSAAQLTLPSCVLPGSGSLLAGLRAALWGFLLAPTSTTLAQMMLFHSGTLLLEGEGYILATFFGLLVPVYLFRTDLGPKLRTRYGRALLLNLRGAVLVAIVLAIAAVYEATEVIMMMR